MKSYFSVCIPNFEQVNAGWLVDELRIHLRLIFVLHYEFEWVILSILNFHLFSFNGCFKWMFFISIKEVNRLTSKGMSNIYLKVTIEKK